MSILLEEALRQRLTDLRLKAGVSEYQLSLSLGLSKGYVQQISSGKAFPSMRHFFDICEYFKISPSEFFDFENKDPQLTRELMSATRSLDEKQMGLLIEIAGNFQRAPGRGDPKAEVEG